MKVKIIERETLNPLAEVDALKVHINPIPHNIDVLSLVDNTKPNADLILDLISKDIEHTTSIKIRKPAGAPATDEQIKQSKTSLSILALGDCGSCTTWLILDAIKLEKQGTPTISLCSDIFVPFARQLAESYGASQLRIVGVKHPIAGQSKEIIRNKTEKTVNQIKNIILKR